jgi:serine protease Do
MPLDGFGEIAEKLRRSTVHVNAGRRGNGSGIIVKPDGVIVTNAHVAAAGPIRVQLWDGTRSPADLLLRDVERDLALLRISKSGLPAATLADSDQLRVGELVIAIGNPLGFTGALTTGVVYAIGRTPGLGFRKWVQADIRLAPGNSGGPLADARGRVVGVNTMIAAGVGLAVPSNGVSRLLERGAGRAELGVVVRPVQVTVQGKECVGLMIVEIIKSSAAEMASLMLGDILIGVEGRSLDSIEDFERALAGVGERVVRLQFLRGDRATIRTVAARIGLPSTAAA